MSEIQRVLFPLDLSLGFPELTVTTRSMLDRSDVQIIMLNAIEEPARSGRGRDVERATAQMDFFASKQFKLAQVRRCVERGRAADCVLEYANRKPIDIIVMAPGGRESLHCHCLGHVTEQVLTQAPCAVWMEWMTGKVKYLRNVFCAVRPGRFYGHVLSRATAVARLFGAEVTTVHADSPKTDLALGRIRAVGTASCMLADGVSDGFSADSSLKHAISRPDAGVLVTTGAGKTVVAAMRRLPIIRLGSQSERAVVSFPAMKVEHERGSAILTWAGRNGGENTDDVRCSRYAQK